MKYIQEFRDGDHVAGVYLCKQKNSAVTKNGKPYDNVILQDKTGSIDCKIWDVGSAGISDFEALEILSIMAEAPAEGDQLLLSLAMHDERKR